MNELEREALRIEGLRGRARSDAIYEAGMTVNTHAQVVLALVDRIDAIAEEPLVCARVRRLRDARRGARGAG